MRAGRALSAQQSIDDMSETTEPAIRVRDLVKTFQGVQALKGVTFDVMPGQVVGFIGANGSGKTTTMRILTTLDLPDSGGAWMNGYNILENPGKVRRMVGWMPDSYGAYGDVSVLDYLDFYARAYGLKGAERVARVREVMEFADLTLLADRPMKGLSKGMAQRLCFGRALLGDPKLLILDEPAAGLDPKARIEFKNLVQILSKQGATILISSHILSELSEMCDALLFIDQGRIVHHGTADALKQRDEAIASIVDMQVDGAEAALVEWLRVRAGWSIISSGKGSVRATFESGDRKHVAEELRRMIAAGLPIVDFHRQERRLEEVFVDVLRAGAEAMLPPPLPATLN